MIWTMSERREAYGADITYGTNNEFGFDYLRDNMKFDLADCVQRGHIFAIVDEVDSILIDEARTPLIISGPSEESTDKYAKIEQIIPKLIKARRSTYHRASQEYTGDYVVDEKHKNTLMTEEGWDKWSACWGSRILSDPENREMMHHVNRR